MSATRAEVAAARTREALAKIAAREGYASVWIEKTIEARRIKEAKKRKFR